MTPTPLPLKMTKNDRLDGKPQKIDFLRSVSARFEHLARLKVSFQPVSMKVGLNFEALLRGDLMNVTAF